MNIKIKNVLKEIYKLEPSLKQYEAQVVQIIEEMVAHKPDTQFDSRFAADLRAKLVAQYSDVYGREPRQTILYRLRMNKLSYGIGAAVMIFFVATPLMYYVLKPGNKNMPFRGSESIKLGWNSTPTISKVSDRAFGSLALQTTGTREMSIDGRGVGLGGGGGGNATTMQDSKMIAPPYEYEMINYDFVYRGEEFEIPQEATVDVLQRIKGTGSQGQMAQLLQSWDIGLVNMNSFDNPKVETIMLYEDKPFGHSIVLNAVEGAININEYYPQWRQTYPVCDTTDCYEQMRLKPEDMPADSELISIANTFLNEYKISRDGYGEPEVETAWKVLYDLAVDKSMAYIPDLVSVKYPLMINGSTVYDENGNTYGISVTINVRTKRATGVGSLTTQDYSSSAYEAETDKNRVLEFAQKGMLYQSRYENPTKTVEVPLGTPKRGYMKQWKYENDRSQEYLIPALLFPILEQPDNNFIYNTHIVVPLAKEVIDEYDRNRAHPILFEPSPDQPVTIQGELKKE